MVMSDGVACLAYVVVITWLALTLSSVRVSAFLLEFSEARDRDVASAASSPSSHHELFGPSKRPLATSQHVVTSAPVASS